MKKKKNHENGKLWKIKKRGKLQQLKKNKATDKTRAIQCSRLKHKEEKGKSRKWEARKNKSNNGDRKKTCRRQTVFIKK